jgi:hypothetical protein
MALYALANLSTVDMYLLAHAIQGQGPVTVAEWTLQGAGNLDYYDGVWFLNALEGLTREGCAFLVVQCPL